MTARSPHGPMGNHVQKTKYMNGQLAIFEVQDKKKGSRVACAVDSEH